MIKRYLFTFLQIDFMRDWICNVIIVNDELNHLIEKIVFSKYRFMFLKVTSVFDQNV